MPNLWHRPALTFADPRRNYTKAFERYALELSRLMTFRMWLGISKSAGDTIKDLVKRDLYKRFKKLRLSKLKQIAIDEISIGHGHRYLTVVLNLETGAVVFVGDGKGLTPCNRSGVGCGRCGPRWRRWRQTCRLPTSRPCVSIWETPCMCSTTSTSSSCSTRS